jgi:hypothetical protein
MILKIAELEKENKEIRQEFNDNEYWIISFL